MKRRQKLKEQLQRNLVALISVFIAVSSLSYNTWRNEKSEYNRNQRLASFEVLLRLGELRELVNDQQYGAGNAEKSAVRAGWAKVITIRDFSLLLEDPVPAAAESLYRTWDEHSSELGNPDQRSVGIIRDEMNVMRDATLDMLKTLD